MALKQFRFRPGLNRDQTNYSNEGGWWAANKIRFLSGFPQKIGGWQKYTNAIYRGVCRTLFNWIVQGGYNLMALGTNKKVYVEAGATLHDITPIRKTFYPSHTDNCFSTLLNDKPSYVNVTITNHGANTGDFVTFSGVAGSVGGIPAAAFNTEFEIVDVLSANVFVIDTVIEATAAAVGGGTSIVAAFQLNIGESSALGGYGWGSPPWGGNTVPATGWGEAGGFPVSQEIRLEYFDNFNKDLIFNVRFGDIYYWEFDSTFRTRAVLLSSRTEPFINVIVPVSVTVVPVSANTYIESVTTKITGVNVAQAQPLILATKLGAVTFSGTYVSVLGVSAIASAEPVRIVAITGARNVPTKVTQILTDDATGYVLALGCTEYTRELDGPVNPLLVRWCSQNNPLNWAPNVDIGISTAGYFEIKAGSAIVYAVQNYGEILIFTSSSLTSAQYVGPTSSIFGSPVATVYEPKLITSDISVIGPRTILVNNNKVYWMGVDKFYVYNGRVETLNCTLRQHVFNNINFTQVDQFFAGACKKFNEIWWFYSSENSTNIDSYVVYNYAEDIWYYGDCTEGFTRTAWLDSALRQYPQAAAGADSYIYNQEIGNDAEDMAFTSYIESSTLDLDDGDQFVLLRRIIPDVSFNESTAPESVTPFVNFSIIPKDFPGSENLINNAEQQNFNRTVSRTTTVPIEQYTNQVFVRARARQMAIRVESFAEKGVSWQLGTPRFDIRPDGRRS